MSDAFPSKWLSAADLRGKTHELTIEKVEMEDVGDTREKPVVYFTGKGKGLVLNITNANAIVDLFGDDTDGWKGRTIKLYPTRVDFKGKMVDAIRVKADDPAPPAEDGDDIPF
jgi:hypothetical protein